MNNLENEQLSLFDWLEPAQEPEEEQTPDIDVSDYCLVYLVTRSGGNQGNIWVLHREDAIKFCSDPCSHGQARGGYWMMMWTSMEHFTMNDAGAKQHQNVHGKLEPFKFIADTGKQDKDFERLGIQKPSITEIADLLRSMGYLMEFEGGYDRYQRCEQGESIENIKTVEMITEAEYE